jgi:transposase
MTREEACALLDGPREEAVAQILELAHKAAQWDQQSAADPLQPSATVAPFKKPAAPRRTRKPPEPHHRSPFSALGDSGS